MEIVPFRKIFAPGNQMIQRYFTKCNLCSRTWLKSSWSRVIILILVRRWQLHMPFNEFQNVCFENWNTFKATNFTVKFVSFMGIWIIAAFGVIVSGLSWGDKSCRGMKVAMTKRNNYHKQLWQLFLEHDRILCYAFKYYIRQCI